MLQVYDRWTSTPSAGRQVELIGVPWGPATVARLLLPEGRTYDERSRRCAPFSDPVDTDESLRRDVVDLAVDALGRGAFVVMNNKAEGSAPLTCFAMAECLAKRLS